MINKHTKAIEIDDIKSLLSDGIPESKSLDYKRALSLNTRDEKIKFLTDVSAFANTSGGDLIYGIVEENGAPKEITGIDLPNIDETILKLEQVVYNGLEPRASIDSHPILLEGSKYVLIVRVEKSHVAPHRVVLDGHDKFYARASRSNYQLDVEGLRTAFNRTDEALNKIVNFRASRVSDIESGHLPLPVIPRGKAILHIFPLDSHQIATKDISSILPQHVSFDHHTLGSYITNFDGRLFHCTYSDNDTRAYLQLYRNGAMEFLVTLRGPDNSTTFWLEGIESLCRFGIKHYFSLYERLGFVGPFVTYLSFTNVKGYRIAGERFSMNINHPIDRDVLLLPEIIVDLNDPALDKKLQPVFDLIWNAVGITQSPSFDEAGNWRTKH